MFLTQIFFYFIYVSISTLYIRLLVRTLEGLSLGGIGEEFKFHLVKWLKICTPIILESLRVKNLI
jgi:hypothetical protein